MTFTISKKLGLPDDAARWTFADLAIKGAGKTYAACVLAEEFINGGVPIVAIDPMGIWWGLRVGINSNAGLPVVVFGGRHADLPIPTSTEKGHEIVNEPKVRLMVKAILQARMSAVIDTSEFSKSMSRRIVAIFISELYKLNQDYGIRHVFLEEADEWIPQRQRAGDAWASAAFGAVDDLVRKGGNFLLGCTLITQRSAVLNKDVLTQINCLVALRILHKLDKDAVKTWIESVANPEDKRTLKFVDSLKDLKNGEAWVWHPEEPAIFERVQFRERTTLHATREYFTRSQFEQKDISMQDVGEFVAKFRKVFEPDVEKRAPIAEPSISVQAPRVVETRSITHDIQSPERPVIETASQEPVKIVQQVLPNITIEQFRPSVKLGVELPNEPSTMLGKVCIVLKNGPAPSNRNDRWNQSNIKERLLAHSWDIAGVEDVIDQLIRWEILEKTSNGYLRFDPSRVQKADRGATIPS